MLELFKNFFRKKTTPAISLDGPAIELHDAPHSLVIQGRKYWVSDRAFYAVVKNYDWKTEQISFDVFALDDTEIAIKQTLKSSAFEVLFLV